MSRRAAIVSALRAAAKRAKRELLVYRRVLADERVPRRAKILLGLAVAYLALPFDLIPDFIPVLGQLDDLVIVPALVYFGLRLVPGSVLAEHRAALVGAERSCPE